MSTPAESAATPPPSTSALAAPPAAPPLDAPRSAFAQQLVRAWKPRLQRGIKTAPAWVPLALIAHIALFGLLPALVESHRLTNEEQALSARFAAAQAEGAAIERLRQAQQDPIYNERELRAARYEALGARSGAAAGVGAATSADSGLAEPR
jgi:hypothetical protein